MNKQIHNIETGEIIIVPLTSEEIAEAEKVNQEIQQQEQEKAEAAARKQALLDKLGITEDEARLLLGGN